MEKTTGVKPKGLTDQPSFPDEFQYLWDWYLDLKGQAPLSYTEMNNWAQLTRCQLLAWEVEVLRIVDRIYWRAISD